MRFHRLALTASVFLALGSVASAGSLEPALQAARDRAAAQTDLPVIIQFAEKIDKAALRREARRLARTLYPDDPVKRKKARRKILRKLLVDALKTQAKDSKQAVKSFLKANKANRKLKLLWARNSVVGDVPTDLLDDLAVQPGVELVKLDARLNGPSPTEATGAPTFWNLDVTGVQGLWSQGLTGAGVVIATLDTGVDSTHPDLGPRWRGGNNSWFDPYGQYGSPADTNGHGTQVMGLIVGGDALGYQIGMAPGAQWIAAKIFDSSNQATLSGIHDAYQWVLDPDGNPATDDAPDIVNNSWNLLGTVNQCNQEFAEDLSLLSLSDIDVVFAGGNYGPDPETSVSPANDNSVLAVGGVDVNLDVDIQSSHGPNACNGGIFPHLVAPGDNVMTADRVPIYLNFLSGTSFAVAHATGGMALLKEAFGDASATQLRASLIQTAVDLGPNGADDTYGHGLMDLPAAQAWLASQLGGQPGTLALSESSYSVDEDVATLDLTVSRTGGSSGDVSVDYATADGSATAGLDYVATSGTLDLADGEVSGTITVTLLDDTLVEGDETFSLDLSNAVGADLGAPDTALVSVLDDDLIDSDGDGVTDAMDQCPNTPAGEAVDVDGCSDAQLDADGDGVTDTLDQCPNTPSGETVDGDGCSASQLDSDSDGVNDSLDLCPGTPTGTPVDADGCALGPVDADGDGFTVDLDCNDADAGINPEAAEIKHDGIDQNCDGYDLTIDITRARYIQSNDRLVVWATSDLGDQANLEMLVDLENGNTRGWTLNWNASKNRWQRTINNFATRFSLPLGVTLSGAEGSETSVVEQR
ncbi:S8 family serine peptidase [Thiorhodococcus mannitoliphagus]|uniref:S8 family serine peptidase n=1 Tax=Thiorhodococcus mannitoliphagus TaxID=329406 RepID=A0A6P1DN34_9GAMM|nr:S8 family serine peptidase [Thiorhodococcus mannitoliphagus]NEX18950.1 S8 family serine peptidase [Thiorhodococcus mannitoliphagus]